jgi:hypothetical protein
MCAYVCVCVCEREREYVSCNIYVIHAVCALSVGAQPSKRVSFLLSQFSLLPTAPLATDFTYKKPPAFTEIPSWWQMTTQVRHVYACIYM